ncbi:MAG: COX15/CtaA family protein [Flavobacteriales bacterium]|nr:COX15/CtaA family protein [Flavobacteriales bacterium]
MNKTEEGKRPLTLWLASGCLLIFAMVVIGGITRLTGSGLSMVEWKPVTGALPPLSEEAWQKAFEDYQQFPEFQQRNFHFTLDDFKSIYWWEYIHRLLGRLIGVVFVVPFIFFYRKKWITGSAVPRALILFAMGGFQGVLGWYMVQSGLDHNPHVSHYRLAAHLMTALATFSYAFWWILDIRRSGDERIQAPAILTWSKLLLAILALQILYGAFVAGLKAGLVFNTWPKMGSQWVADGVTAMDPWWTGLIDGLAGVQFVHRTLAYGVALLALWLAFRIRKNPVWSLLHRTSLWLIIAVSMQFILGVVTLLTGVPVVMGVLHQAGAFLLLAVVLSLCHRLGMFRVFHSLSSGTN